MATGSFHGGGGGHTGSHHSGGFSFGGFGGGSSSGGDFGGGYYSDDDGIVQFGDPVYIATIVVFVNVVIFWLYFHFGAINFLSFLFYVATEVILIICVNMAKRTNALRDIRASGNSYGVVWKGECSANYIGDDDNWADKNAERYRISFTQKETRRENIAEVSKAMHSVPGIVWLRTGVWLFISIGLFIFNFFSYELIIPVFERADIGYLTFRFADNLVFYFPSVISLLNAVAFLVVLNLRDEIMYRCAVRIARNVEATNKRSGTEHLISKLLSERWYHSVCPNCGSKMHSKLKTCPYCGTYLEVVDFSDGYSGSFQRIDSNDESDG